VCFTANCVAGTTITIQPSEALFDGGNKLYTVFFVAGTVIDTAGNAHDGLAAFPPDYQFRLQDITPPLLTSFDPVQNSTSVLKTDNIVLTFVENIQAGSGNIVITPSGGNTHYNGVTYVNEPVVISVVDQTQVTFSGLVCTINPAFDLVDILNKTHTVTIATGVIIDADLHPYLGFSGAHYNFEVADHTIPTLMSFFPVQGVSHVAPSSNIVLQFSDDVRKGTSGEITLTPLLPNVSAPIVFSVNTSSEVTVSNAVVTIDPPNDLVYDILYTVTISGGAFTDQTTTGNPMPALLGTSYQFTITFKLRLIFSTNIQAGTGVLRLYASDTKTPIDIDISDATKVSIQDNAMTLIPIDGPASAEYFISIGKDVIMDTSTPPRGFAGAAFNVPYASGDHYLQFRTA